MLRECLTVCVATSGGHFEHLQQHCPSPSLHPHLGTKELALESHRHTTKEKSMCDKLKTKKQLFQDGAAALCR